MAIFVSDSFTEAAKTAITSHTADSGATWSLWYGATPVPDVYTGFGGAVASGATTAQAIRASEISPSADTYLTVNAFIGTATGSASGVLARMNSGGTAAYAAFYFWGTSKWGVYRVGSGGSTTLLAEQSGTTTYVANATPEIKFNVTGSGATVTLELIVNGSTLVSTTDTDAARITAAGYVGLWFNGSPAATSMFFSALTASDTADSMTITGPSAGRVHPLSSGATGTATFALTGTYTGTAPDQWRLVEDGGSTSVSGFDWASFSSAPSAGTFSQTISSVPKLAGWYNIQVRNSAAPSNIYTSGKVGAGVLVVVDGQSQAWLWFSSTAYAGNSSLTPNSLLRITGVQPGTTTWAVPDTATMNGAIACGNALVTGLGCPVGLIDGSWDASGLLVPASGGATGVGGQWISSGVAGTALTASNAAITAAGGAAATIWIQGEGDAGAGITQANYYTALGQMIAIRRTHTSNATHPYVLALLARNDAGMADANREAIKLAQVQKCADTGVYRVERMDLPLHTDGVHHTAAGFTSLGQRCAQAVLAALGVATYYRGPRISSVVQIDSTTFDVNFTVTSPATTVTPATSVTGFRVLVSGSPVTISSATRQSATKVRLVLASAPGSLPTVQYLYGSLPTITGIVKDDSTLTLPAEYNAGVLASAGAATSVTLTLTTDGSTAAASLTGLKWAFFDAMPGSFAAPVAQGTTETTNGSGSLVLDITGSALAPGATGWLIVTDSDGTTTQDPAGKAFSGPVVVA